MNNNIPLKRGCYETEYGNCAYVSGPSAKTAWDVDMGERIPISMVDGSKYLGPGNKQGVTQK